jgi:hypothetical protein
MPVMNDAETLVFFRASITTTVGNGASTFFWTDHWLNGQSIGELAPELLAVVLLRRRKKRTVCSTLIGNAWLSDIADPLTLPVIIQYIQVRALMDAVILSDQADSVA